jgi:hypothetical protein
LPSPATRQTAAKADAARDGGDMADAIKHYRKAWECAVKASDIQAKLPEGVERDDDDDDGRRKGKGRGKDV